MKKGFTLVELLGIIIILGIIALIAFPLVNYAIKNSKKEALERTIDNIEKAAHDYSVQNDIGYPTYKTELPLIEIQSKGYLDNKIINPITNEEMQGCVWYYWNETTKQYNFEYDGECKKADSEPIITIIYDKNLINSNGWSKEDISVTIQGNGEIKYCMSDTVCEPNEVINIGENTKFVTTEGTTNICGVVSNSLGTSEVLCEEFKLDKTLPTISGIEDKVVQKDEEVDLTNGVTYNDALSGIDGKITIEPSSIDTSILGEKEIKYSIKDKAGNIREVLRRITVDASVPTIEYKLIDESSINSNGWAKENFYVRATITDNSGSGIKSAKSCVTNSSEECSPIAEFTGNTKDFYVEVEGNNRLCLEVTDNNNKTNKVCSDTYKLDKTAPIAGTATISGTAGTNGWYKSNVTLNKEDGSDALSGHSSTTINVTSITSNTSGQTVTITTTDMAGNTATRDYTIKIDKTAPDKASLSVSSSTSNSITVNASGSDSISGIYSYTFQKSTTSSTSGFTTVETKTATSTNYSYTYTGLSSSLTYYLRVIVTDEAGNTKTSAAVSETLNVPPSIPSVSVSSKTTNSITLAAKSTDLDGDKLTYKLYTGTSTNNLTLAATSAATTSGTQVTLKKASLSQYTTYYYRVDVSDGTTTTTGNVSSARTYCPGGSYSSGTCSTCGGTGTVTTSNTVACNCSGRVNTNVNFGTCATCGGNLSGGNYVCTNSNMVIGSYWTCQKCGRSWDSGTSTHYYSVSSGTTTCYDCGGSGTKLNWTGCIHGYTTQHD